MARVVEILLYKLKPATGDEFLAIMRDVSVPLHRQSGIDVVWHGRSMHDPDAYGLIRAFADMASLEATQSAFYAGNAWRTGPRAAIIERIETATKIVIPMSDRAIDALREQGYP